MNNQNNEITETIKRTKRYWYVDGFAEISIGVILTLTIMINKVIGQVQKPLLQITLSVVGLPLIIILGGRGMGWMVRQLKEKFTYPRTGYVAYPHNTGSQRWKRVLLSGIIGFVFAAVFSIFSGVLPEVYQYIFAALIIALAYIYIGYSIGLVRFYLIAAVSLALMGFLLTLDLAADILFLSFFIGQGLIWIISGSITLYKYLHATQPSGTKVGS